MEFTITKRNGKSFTILYDECDHAFINSHKWHLSGNPAYVKTNIKQSNGGYKSIMLHRIILGIVGTKLLGDHANRNQFDNRRFNLRICNKQANNCNASSRKNSTSKFKGVDWDSTESRWRAQIQYGEIKKYLGRFKIETDAAKAYDKAAIKLHGEFAKLNFT